jgi:SAM-dependent methyltransferase
MSWSEYEKWSFSLTKDVLAHLQFLVYCVILSLRRRALEIGSGTGLQSTFLSFFGVEVVSIDLDPLVSKMALRISKYYKAKKISFVAADARFLPFKPKSFGLSFSQGLLEHLSNKTIFDIVSETKKAVAGKMLFSVPSRNFPEQDFGDERLMYPSEWKTILSPFNAYVHYYFFDFQSIKNSVTTRKLNRPWHIQISITN